MVFSTDMSGGRLPNSVRYSAQHMQMPAPFHISPLIMLALMIPCDAESQAFT